MNKIFLIASLGLMGATSFSYAHNATLAYKTGFENPPFLRAPLLVVDDKGIPTGGQDGWAGAPPLSPSAAKISNVLPRQGKQSLIVSGEDLVSQPFINAVTSGYYNAIGSYRKSVNFNTLGKKSVRISGHVRVNGSKTPYGMNVFSAGLGGVGSTLEVGGESYNLAFLGELLVSSDGYVYGHSGNGFVPGCDPDADTCPAVAKFKTAAKAALNQWHKLVIDINFKKRTYAFTVDDSCLGTFAFVTSDNDGDPKTPPVMFAGNYLRRASLQAYARPDTASYHKAEYAAAYDQFKIQEVDDEPEDCIKH